MTDFIIVGRGLAATALMHRFHQSGISFRAIGNPHLSSCSRVAAGIWNPVVFKRFTKSWMADTLIAELNLFYGRCEETLQKKLITPRAILKPFGEEQEKTLWRKKAKNELENFLSETFQKGEELEQCRVPNEYGIVKQAGSLNMEVFLDASAAFFKKHMIEETFAYNELTVVQDVVTYKDINAKNIIFCEGHMVKQNPFFKWIPLKPVKGELLDITSEELKLNNTVFNRDGFLMDVGDQHYRIGATYNWTTLNEQPTLTGRRTLEEKLKHMISCNYTVAAHKAGIRPASIDRRPIIGSHPVHANLYVFNGLGTKGVMLAPYFSGNFVNFYLKKEALQPEADVKRFYDVYEGLQKK